MNYTIEDKEFIEQWLSKCIIIKNKDHILYVTNKNIIRHLKYSKILEQSNKNFNIDLNILNTNNIILKIDSYNKIFSININILRLFFKDRYQNNFYHEQIEKVNNILSNIFNLKNYNMYILWENYKYKYYIEN